MSNRRSSDDPGEQPDEGDTRSSTAKAIDIVSRLITVCLCFVLPIVGGWLLDKYLGTVVLFLLAGLLFGFLAAGVQLMKMFAPGGILATGDEPVDKTAGRKYDWENDAWEGDEDMESSQEE